MSDKKSSQAIATFYLNDDPTLILESEEEAASFNAELKAQVQRKLARMASSEIGATIPLVDSEKSIGHKDTAELPFSYEYVLGRLKNSILSAEAANNTGEVERLQSLLDKMQKQELLPVHVVRQAWLKS